MSSWLAVQNYSVALTLLAGLGAVVGLGGVGQGLSRRLGLHLPAGFAPLTALALGTLSMSISVFALGVLDSTTPPALLTLYGLFVVAGSAELARSIRASRPSWPDVPRAALAVVAVVGAAAICVAVAPPLHPDDVFYHLLTPARLLSDGGLRFYQHPMQGAALSQMGYQLGATPLHALGLPGAWAILGVAFWASLVWLGAQRAHQVAQEGGSRAWTGLVVAGLAAGFYPTIWYATAGAHGMGDATLAGAVLLALNKDGAVRQRVLPVTLLLVGAACTKISVLPMVTLVWVAVTVQALRAAAPGTRRPILVMALLPWAIWQAPLLLWTWAASGSPWGPFFAGVLGESVYDLTAIQETMGAAKTSGMFDPGRIALFALGFLNPVLWLSLLWALLTAIRERASLLLVGVVALQVALVLVALPLDARYLGGLQYVGLLFLAARPPRGPVRALSRWVGVAAATMLTVPWALMGAAEARGPSRVVLGQVSAEAYCRSSVPLFDALERVDAVLPADAALLALRNTGGAGGALPSAYAPRPVALIPADIPPDRRPFLFWVGPRSSKSILEAVEQQTSWRLGDALIAPHAVTWTTRGRRPRRASFGLFALEVQGEAPAKASSSASGR